MRNSVTAVLAVLALGCADGGAITDTESFDPAFLVARDLFPRDPGMESVGNDPFRDFGPVPGVERPLSFVLPYCETFTDFAGLVTSCDVEPWTGFPSNSQFVGGMGMAGKFLTTQNYAQWLGSDFQTPEPIYEIQDIVRSGMEGDFLVDAPGAWQLEIPYSLHAVQNTPGDATVVFTLLDGAKTSVIRKRVSSLRPCPDYTVTVPDDVMSRNIPVFWSFWEVIALAAPDVTATYTRCSGQDTVTFRLKGGAPPGRYVRLRIQLDEAVDEDGDPSTDAPLFLRLDPNLFGPRLSIAVEPRRISLSSPSTIDVVLYSTLRFDAEYAPPATLQVGSGESAEAIDSWTVDSNGDGHLDQVFRFRVQKLVELGLSRSNSELMLHGVDRYGWPFEAVDPNGVKVVN